MGIIGYKPGNESYDTVNDNIREAYARVGLEFEYHSSIHQVDPQMAVCRAKCCQVLGIPEDTAMRVYVHIGYGHTYYIVDHDHIWNGRVHDSTGAITDFVFEVEDEAKLMMLKLILS
jgi:hypothetical protein